MPIKFVERHALALGETGDGQHYIAMELVEGETLRQRLSTARWSVRESRRISRLTQRVGFSIFRRTKFRSS